MNSPSPTMIAIEPSGPLAETLGFQSMGQVAVSLLFIIASVILLAWILRRITRLQSNALGGLRVVGGLSVGTRERVVLLAAGDTQLLVGVAPGYLRTLHVFERPLESAESTVDQDASFSMRLKRAVQG